MTKKSSTKDNSKKQPNRKKKGDQRTAKKYNYLHHGEEKISDK